MKNKAVGVILGSILLLGCGGDSFTPKPQGYFRIDLPEKEYVLLEKDCPFTFELPIYTTVKPNINNPDRACWFDIHFNQLNASVYISYKDMEDGKYFNQYLEDSRTLAFKHTIKAFDIQQERLSFPENNVYGLVYRIDGNAASSLQFHVHDSLNHFVRGSLYFNNVPNQDSIQPVLDFVKEDIEHMFSTFKWK